MKVFKAKEYEQSGKAIIGFLIIFSSTFIVPFLIPSMALCAMIVGGLLSLLYARLFMFNRTWNVYLKRLEHIRLRNERNKKRAILPNIAIVKVGKRIITL